MDIKCGDLKGYKGIYEGYLSWISEEIYIWDKVGDNGIIMRINRQISMWISNVEILKDIKGYVRDILDG